MSGVICKHERYSSRLSPSALLSWVWLVGLLIGLMGSFVGRDNFATVFSGFNPVTVSAPRKLFITLLPFLLSVLTVSFIHRSWLYLICGAKAVCFAICCFLLCLCYGQAGWLACFLFMFFDVCSLPCLFFYWMRQLCTQDGTGRFQHIIFFLIIAVLAIIDYRIVTPYAAKFGFI